ncbi:MAG: signal peptidase I [Opitutaceae bacterium]|nr:signal peptidase I [Opitutaceae bacterium]
MNFRRKLIRIVVVGVAAAVWLSGVRLFAFAGESMAPAVMPGDHFVGLVGLWHQRAPRRFDRVILDLPPTSKWADRKIPWMKRVVGLPGEHVRLAGTHLFIDGRRIDAPCLRTRSTSESRGFEMKLGRDEYCVLGDNLDHTFEDSRSMGPINRSLIKGYVAFVIHSSNTAPRISPGLHVHRPFDRHETAG